MLQLLIAVYQATPKWNSLKQQRFIISHDRVSWAVLQSAGRSSSEAGRSKMMPLTCLGAQLGWLGGLVT